MDGAGDEEYSGFSRGRDAAKLKPDIVASRKKVSFNTYNINDFKFLVGTRHIDDEDGLPYKIVGIRDHRGFIAADRKLLFSKQVTKFDSITALDALSLTLRADPHFKAPFRFEQQENLPHSKRRKNKAHTQILQKSPISNTEHAHIMSEKQGVGGKSPILQPDAVGGGGKKPTSHLTTRAFSETTETDPNQHTDTAKKINNFQRKMKVSAIDRETVNNDMRRSKRLAELNRVYTTFVNLADLEEAEIRRKIFINFNTLSNITVPKTYEKAMISRDAPQWQKAVDEELKGLHDTDCYTEEYLPPGKKAIFSKWVLTIKTDSLGNIRKYKARCTCRGDMLQYDEYNEVSSPVVSWTGIRTFLALTTLYHLIPLQLDINLAYLNAPLEEDVYMYPPQALQHPKVRSGN